jgi:hypothetical protein
MRCYICDYSDTGDSEFHDTIPPDGKYLGNFFMIDHNNREICAACYSHSKEAVNYDKPEFNEYKWFDDQTVPIAANDNNIIDVEFEEVA